MCNQKHKNFYIISLCPIPNFIILFYYIFSVKILVDEDNITYCEGLWVYNFMSFLLLLGINIYLVSQLFSESPTIIMNRDTKHMLIQLLFYFLLLVSVIGGGYKVSQNNKCKENSDLLYTLASINLVIHTVILVIMNGFLIYLGCYTHAHKILPV
jgi:hypothetical protein